MTGIKSRSSHLVIIYHTCLRRRSRRKWEGEGEERRGGAKGEGEGGRKRGRERLRGLGRGEEGRGREEGEKGNL